VWRGEVLEAVKDALGKMDAGYPKDSEVKFHVLVTVERPQ
jgi:hypothetical protein